MVARRYITRPADAGGENHLPVSHGAMQQMLEQGHLAMHWSGNGHRYGIDRGIDAWLDRGRTVLVNGSRGYLSAACARYPTLSPVLVRVSEPVLRARLLARGRESSMEIEQRIARARRLTAIGHPGLRIIDNDGPLHEAGEALLRLVAQDDIVWSDRG